MREVSKQRYCFIKPAEIFSRVVLDFGPEAAEKEAGEGFLYFY